MMRSILQQSYANPVALVIGNGINRYNAAGGTNSWEGLLDKLSRRNLPESVPQQLGGLALTEFYDLLELRSRGGNLKTSLQQQFCKFLAEWCPYDHHRYIVSWAQQNNAPILTTNFDRVLGEAGKYSLMHLNPGRFTDFYPWESYYGIERIEDPSRAFGIWHVNGMMDYPRSLRLGLTHYMGAVERARRWLHRRDRTALFAGKDISKWRGARSWLHVFFHNPLLIFGLGLDETEVFIRWLLIERARYFKKFPDMRQPAWYVDTKNWEGSGKKVFLEEVGVQVVQVQDYDQMYGPEVWGHGSRG